MMKSGFPPRGLAPSAWAASAAATNGAAAVAIDESADSAPPTRRVELYSSQWLFTFVGVEFACQFLLLIQAIAPARLLVRTAAFLGSLAYLFVLPKGTGRSHPSARMAVLVIVIVTASILHPDTSSPWAGIASTFLHLAVLAPIFWVPRLRIDAGTVRKLFLMFWAINTVSAFVGALQVYFPGRFQPALTTVLADSPFIDGLKISLVDGSSVFRPMGLTDSPGGAAIGGTYCTLLATAFILDAKNIAQRAMFLASMALGLFVLYLCQVRSLMVMVAISVLAMSIPFSKQGRSGSFIKIAISFFALATAAFGLAVAVAGTTVTDRLFTLVESDPGTVYYSNRGLFLQYTFNDLLPLYPLGCGLARWGMIAGYFADRTASLLWAEIQWTGWLYDGGVPLMIAYTLAIGVALVTAVRIAERTTASPELQKMASVLFGYGVGTFATTFNGCPFESTSGIDFWILNATVFAASCQLAARDTSAT